MEISTGRVEVNGLTFHYLEAGRGPLVLCLHGFPDNAYTCNELLLESRRMVPVDATTLTLSDSAASISYFIPDQDGPMVSHCWVCRRQTVLDHINELLQLLLSNLKRRRAVHDSAHSCEELQSRSDVAWVRFYRLECGHYCAHHIDHRCCWCRAKQDS